MPKAAQMSLQSRLELFQELRQLDPPLSVEVRDKLAVMAADIRAKIAQERTTTAARSTDAHALAPISNHMSGASASGARRGRPRNTEVAVSVVAYLEVRPSTRVGGGTKLTLWYRTGAIPTYSAPLGLCAMEWFSSPSRSPARMASCGRWQIGR